MTTSKIEKLTPEQEASIPVFRDKWLDIGLSTAPINHTAAIAAACKAYECGKATPPKLFLFASGPTEAMMFLTLTDKVTWTKEQCEAIVDAHPDDPLAFTKAYRTEIGKLDTIPKKPQTIWPGFYGNHEAGWLGFHDFFNHHFQLSELSQGLRELAQQSCWVWLYEELCVISARPTRISMRNERLHDEKKAAIEYADGTKVYAYNGVSIPGKWVVERDTMDPGEILAETDTDKRAAGIALYGYARMKHKLNYKIIEGDPTTDIGALIEITIPGLSRPGRFLEAICPRNGPVFLGVPQMSPFDNNRAITTAVEAQAFLARLPASEYMHPPIRT